jgi:multidrug resistance efflux pump
MNEEKIIAEEKKVLAEIKQEEEKFSHTLRHVWIMTILASAAVALVIVLGAYLYSTHKTIYIEKSEINAPRISISPQNAGILNAIYVHEGDSVGANTTVAKVGNELIKTKDGGIVVSASNEVGKLVNPGEAVVVLVNQNDLRVLGSIQEDSGLSDIHIGAFATFTADAFGGKKYSGIVDEISPVSKEGDVVFNISDKRQEQQFVVKVRYDESLYPELKPGMSAKLWINK